ncbi:MAG: acyl-CoA desaturase [Vicinamibacterales bacterium]|nr:acyl-CoA desaturase [Vicinamibacterales bacterium]
MPTTEIVFATPAVLKIDLDRRVLALIGGRRTVDSPLMYAKAAGLVGTAACAYVMLVFYTRTPLLAALWGGLLAGALVGIGFNVQHDGNHGTFSRRPWVNRLAGFSLDLIGASSYFWKDKHNHGHHVYTNIPQEDADIELGPLARLSEDHQWRWWHRYQHVYLWFLYTFVHLRYLYSDLQRLMLGKRDRAVTRYPQGGDLAALLVGKALFLVAAFVIPLTVHPFGRVAGVYVLVSMAMGLVFSIVFQLAHTVDVVEHPMQKDNGHRPEWAVHQIATTANFAPDNRFLTFVLGGLNYQREHHLFPRVAHVHYPAFAHVVRDVCAEQGIVCRENATFAGALRSHYRFVRAMGRKPA